MDCEHIRSLFTACQDREISPPDLLAFEAHLAACPHCAREWQDFRKTLRLLQEMRPLPVPSDLLPGIHEKLGQRRGKTRLQELLQRFFPPLPTTAASLAAAALAVMVLIKTHDVSGPETSVLAPSAPIARVEPLDAQEPSLTMPVSVGQPAGDDAGFLPYAAISRPPFPFLLKREATESDLLAAWHDQVAAMGIEGPLGGPSSAPDIVVKVHHLSPEGMDWLHRRIDREGRWQTRGDSRDRFLVLVDPGELSAFYELLQRQHLPFSVHSSPVFERDARKPLLVSVRP
ncbi:MAG: zf-HC2 domain-containing protein [Desulfobacteraceae bacterium]|nr:zf-HC2 domain-containing protein [Desulfobacteraceae bacterium]